MKNAKKFISILILGCVICTHSYNVCQTCYAAEAVVAGGLSSVGVALLGLGAVAGVGIELDNNRRFNELSDQEKERIENGLATDFNDVALQRGASIEHIKNWTTDLCNGVLDKASECWGIFKDWVKNINLTETSSTLPPYGVAVSPDVLLGYSATNKYGYTFTINSDVVNRLSAQNISWSNIIGYQIEQPVNSSYAYYINVISRGYNSTEVRTGDNNVYSYAVTKYNSIEYKGSGKFMGYNAFLQNNIAVVSSYPVRLRNNTNYQWIDGDFNGEGYIQEISYFSTNTDYLEKLKGQDEDVIDVIDVTDIKNPIVESRSNNLANINWNRGTRRTNNNNNDDDDKIVTGLVPMDVWYEQIDEEQEEMQNAVVVYDNYIQEHPEEKDTYFISTQPINNINNYFNTLPVVNLPTQGTVINNYYEYNNYNNNNNTIYELPYNTELVPQIPTMVFENKFPFCIPFDIYQFFAMFYVEKEAPHIVVPVPFKGSNGVFAEELTIDLSDYNYVSDVLRVMLYLLFIVGLMVATRRLIKG